MTDVASRDPALRDIVASDLSIGYHAHGGAAAYQAIEGVSFSVARGGVFAILGESGAGKSTLARTLAGRAAEAHGRAAAHINGGEATVLGESLRGIGHRKRDALTARIGYVAQNAGGALPGDLTVQDVLLEPIAERTKRFDRRAVGSHIAEMLDRLELPLTVLAQYPYELSRGQRQRIALVRGFVTEPSVLVADEPTSGVDVGTRPLVTSLIEAERERTGLTVLLVSHDIPVLEQLVDELIVLQKGSMVGRGTIETVFAAPEHPYVANLAEALRSTAYDELYES